jgi:ribosomal protein L35
MTKTLKLAAKRLRITRNKKIIRRTTAQCHFKSKEGGNMRRSKRKVHQDLSPIMVKMAKRLSLKK